MIDEQCQSYKVNDEYKKELKELRERMVGAENFAKKLPLFRAQILSSKLSEEDNHIQFGNSYKSIPLQWGINRGYYKTGTNRYITNMETTHNGYYFCIYINTIALFDAHKEFGLYDKVKDCNIYFTDSLNTTFYVEDLHIEHFLETINEWYVEAHKDLDKLRKSKKIKNLKSELEALEDGFLPNKIKIIKEDGKA